MIYDGNITRVCALRTLLQCLCLLSVNFVWYLEICMTHTVLFKEYFPHPINVELNHVIYFDQ